ncbi:hypothetical protein LOK49_LG06G02955 [Camellia lanceoleosa]|uniref:Uncharacterized protein n=1 Tax=Camellia lanceoleosa TaxID=1840588 RepID=A0ACC0HGN7_9ERIC|nr:hypothetical protein LOK49_LG06G02955 [Camellia lanceoleosa]
MELNLEETTEEEDHLIRSTKKIKSYVTLIEAVFDNETNMEFEVSKEGLPPHATNDLRSPTSLPSKAFKDALNQSRRGDYIFDSRVEILSSDEKDNETEGYHEIQHSYSEQLGVPKSPSDMNYNSVPLPRSTDLAMVESMSPLTPSVTLLAIHNLIHNLSKPQEKASDPPDLGEATHRTSHKPTADRPDDRGGRILKSD